MGYEVARLTLQDLNWTRTDEPSGYRYYEQKAREADPSPVRDIEFRKEIERVWKEPFGVSGARKVCRSNNSTINAKKVRSWRPDSN